MRIAELWLVASVVSAGAVAADLVRGRGQKMWIMNVVWPVTALWAGPLGAWAYAVLGRADNRRPHGARQRDSFGAASAKATTHCGAGCTLGDVAAAALTAAAPFTIAGRAIFGEWLYGLIGAFAFGIAFQYFAIRPMQQLSRRAALAAALKADALSLAAWQLGMYGAMAIVRFAIVGHPLSHASAGFWIAMQIAMLAGFAVSLPVNALLIRRGIKHAM
jgi:hypothetical protein